MHEPLRSQATDALTGLPSRSVLLVELEWLIRAARPFSLLMLDLDDFKVANGTYLHEQGDRLLRRTAQILTVLCPATALPARIGGDEFAVLLASAAAEEAIELGQRICAAVATIEVTESDDGDPVPWRLGCSVGVARYPEHARVADHLLAAADRAVYRAKRAGGGRVANPGSDERTGW